MSRGQSRLSSKIQKEPTSARPIVTEPEPSEAETHQTMPIFEFDYKNKRKLIVDTHDPAFNRTITEKNTPTHKRTRRSKNQEEPSIIMD